MFPPKSEEYKELIHEYIVTKLIEQIEKVNPSLKRETTNLLHLESKIDIQIKEDSTGRVKRPLPPEVLEELKKALGKKEQALPEETRSEKAASIYPKPSSIFTGMAEEIKKFQELLGKVNFISIEGAGGFGKTEFAAKCIDEFIQKDKVVWFDCLPESKLDSLIGLAGYAEVLKGENKTELAKYSGFTDLIERDEKVLFLDNFHDIADPSFNEFFKFCERRINKAKIILISRDRPNVGVRVAPVDINGLKDAAVDFAKKLKETFYSDASISDAELKDICNEVDGHPLAIELALQLISYGESTENIVKKIVQADDRSTDLSHRLLDEIFSHPNSTEQEKKVMLLFSVFRGDVDKKAISYLLEGEDADATLRRLFDKKMIARSGDRLSTHPLVREFCYKKLENKKEAHLKASDYLKTIRTDKFDPLLEGEIAYHLFSSESFKALADLISEKGEEFILTGNTNSLKEMIDKVIVKAVERPIFYILYGNIATIRGEWNSALSFYEKVFSLPNVDENAMAEAYIEYGEILFRRGDVKESLRYFEDAYETCKKTGYKKGEAWSLNDIGLVHEVFGNLDIAEKKLNEALQLRMAIGDQRRIADSVNNIGNFFSSKGDDKNALTKYHESLKIRKILNDKAGTSIALFNLGSVLLDMGKISEAYDEYEQCLKIANEIGNKQIIAKALNGLGRIFYKQSKYKEALKMHYEGLKIAEEIGDKDEIAVSHNHIGNFYYANGDPNKALAEYNQSLDILKEIGIKRGIASTVSNIANCLKALGKRTEALELHKRSLLLWEEIGNRRNIITSHDEIAAFLFEQKKYSLSLSHLFQALALTNQTAGSSKIYISHILKIRTTIGQKEFKKLAYQTFDTIPDALKQFVNLEELTTDATVHYETPKVGRNDPCPCGSGKKYKKCCGK